MGMSASQARLLSITARINDVEFKSQSISNTKIRLADESEKVANDYTKALNKTKLVYNGYDQQSGSQIKVSLNSDNISSVTVLNPDYDENDPKSEKYIQRFELVSVNGAKVPEKYTESQLYEMIESGEYMLRERKTYTDENGVEQFGFRNTSVSGSSQLAIEADSTELAKAEAEYNAATAKINKKEKLLDNDLKALDTEHNALKTEFESAKSLIGENVEKTFNLFS